MAATVKAIARDVLGSVHSDAGFLTAVHWIDNRYQELVSRVRFKHLRQIGEVQIPATYETGTVTTTRDSTTVTGDSTAWTTTPGSGSQEYWYMKVSTAWYKVSSVASATSITLSTNFSETAVSAGSYKLVKRHHPLSTTARWLGDFVLTRLNLPLGGPIALEQLDREAPGRPLTDQFPTCVAQVGVDSNNYLMVEFYPYSNLSEIIHYVYWNLPTTLAITSTVPAQVDGYILKEGALIDMYRYLKAKARNAGQFELANSWRNDEFAQMTKWENYIRQAVQTDQGADDRSFILSRYGRSHGLRGIRTAHDYVYSNWSYPG